MLVMFLEQDLDDLDVVAVTMLFMFLGQEWLTLMLWL